MPKIKKSTTFTNGSKMTHDPSFPSQPARREIGTLIIILVQGTSVENANKIIDDAKKLDGFLSANLGVVFDNEVDNIFCSVSPGSEQKLCNILNGRDKIAECEWPYIMDALERNF